MLTMAILDVEILAVRLFTVCFTCFSQMAPTSIVQVVGSLRGYRVGVGLKVGLILLALLPTVLWPTRRCVA